MEGYTGQHAPPLAGAANRQRALQRFAEAWQQGDAPRLEGFLAEVAPAERALLLRELLEIEFRNRQQRGQDPSLEEYCQRFPDQAQMVESLYRRLVRRRLGDYEILDELGHGGMGVVYLAQHTLLNQLVAVKVLPERCLGDRQAVQRFRREMLSVGGLNHPHIVRALNAGEDHGTHYLVTEFVDGVTLERLVVEWGPLPLGVSCELVRQAAVGLQYVDEHGLVHRDIKPSNLMLAGNGVVKILDLGLARLDSDPLPTELTQVGMALGTVDYMAPEQWEDPRAVDIRADIYGLGCTLYFLLSGAPPYAENPHDSKRKRLAAHMTSPIPLLSARREDLPPDLDRILENMLAKEPDERFETPAEVAAALEPLARFPEVKALATTLQTAASPGGRPPGNRSSGNRSSVARAAGPRRDEKRGEARVGVSPDRSTRGGSDRPAPRPLWKLLDRVEIIAVLVAGLAVWIALNFAFRGSSSNFDSASQIPSVPAGAALEVATLPGLNGRWWFDETPWLIPPVRQALAAALSEPGPAAGSAVAQLVPRQAIQDPNVQAVQNRLLQAVEEVRPALSGAQSQLLDELLALSQEDLLDEQLALRLREALVRFLAATGPPATWQPADLHTKAVLEHKVAAVASDASMAERARASYAAALDGYRRNGVAALLRGRCLIDSGLLQALVLRDYPAARQQFREARQLEPGSRLLQAEAWVDEGIASVVANRETAEKYTVAGEALTSALERLQDPQAGFRHHPFLAHAHERYAWILMDQWNVRSANEHFKEARNIRFDNFWKSENAFAQIFVFHNEHGQAMAERYCGDAKLSRAQYDLVIGEVEKALAGAADEPDRPGLQRFRRDLRERLSNSCERRADCELYQGAARGAGVDLPEAIRLYAVARDQADDPAVRIAMSCKRAIVLALDGQLAEARRELEPGAIMDQVVIGVHEERVRLLRGLAEAVLTVTGDDRQGGLVALRAFLDAFERGTVHPDRRRRETQELQLLAAELLVDREYQDPALREAALRDVAYLDRLIAAFPYRDQMLTYLRRYYDLAVEVVETVQPDRAAEYIAASRGQRLPADAPLLLFHFQAERGRAVVRLPAGTSHCFPLDFGRRRIRQAVAGSEPAPALPPLLLEQLPAFERAAGRPLVLFWDDRRAWATSEAALTRADWPFASQLELEQFKEPAEDKATL